MSTQSAEAHIGCLVAGGCEVSRVGVCNILRDGGFNLLWNGSDLQSLPRQVQELRPALVVALLDASDSDTPCAGHEEWCFDLRAQLLVVSTDASARAVELALAAGATGYVHTSSSGDDLLVAARTVAAGKRYLHPDLGVRVLEERQALQRAGLTARELEVLRYIALGYTNREIAETIYASVRTVESHRAHIMTKLRVRRRSELVAWARDHHIMDDPVSVPV